LREELYVEPHQGYASGSPSKDQMRRAVKTLERAGLISIHSEGKKLIVKCELATWDYCDQNKVATKAPHILIFEAVLYEKIISESPKTLRKPWGF